MTQSAVCFEVVAAESRFNRREGDGQIYHKLPRNNNSAAILLVRLKGKHIYPLNLGSPLSVTLYIGIKLV